MSDDRLKQFSYSRNHCFVTHVKQLPKFNRQISTQVWVHSKSL